MYIDNLRFKEKPEGKAIGMIVERSKDIRAGKKMEIEPSLHELTAVIQEGRTVIPNNPFVAGEIWLFVDVDSKLKGEIVDKIPLEEDYILTYQDIKDRLSSSSFQYPNIIYNSFSHRKERPRFRLIWLLNERISLEKFKALYSHIREILEPEPGRYHIIDRSCSTTGKPFYGTNGACKLIHEKPLSIEGIELKEKTYTPMRERDIAAGGELERLLKTSGGVRKILNGSYGYPDGRSIVKALRIAGVDIGNLDIEEVVTNHHEPGSEKYNQEVIGWKDTWRSEKIYAPERDTPGYKLLKYIRIAQTQAKKI